MKSIIQIIKSLTASIILFALMICISIIPISISISNYLTNRENIKTTLNNSNIYEDLSKYYIQNLTQNISIPTKQLNSIKSKLDKILTPEIVQKEISSIIDSTYDWLERKTTNIQLSKSQFDIQTKISEILPKTDLNSLSFLNYINTLPPCTDSQLKKYETQGGFSDPKDFCIPPNLDTLLTISKGYDNTIGEKNFSINNLLNIPQISDKDTNNIQKTYSNVKNYPILITIVTLILCAIYLVISPNKYKYYITGATGIVIGISNYILWKSNYVSNLILKLTENQLPNITNLVISQEKILLIEKLILQQITEQSTIYSIYIIIIGILISLLYLLISKLMTKK